MKKNKSRDQQIADLHAELQRDIDRWNDIKVNGCNDPFWPDGVNLNLKRNHIIYDLRQLAELQQSPVQLSFFTAMGVTDCDTLIMSDKSIPPEVPNDFMVKDRFENGRRIR